MNDQPRTADDLFEWLNSRFGCHLPRLADIIASPALEAFWNMNLAIVKWPPQDPTPTLTIDLIGKWTVMTHLVLDHLSITVTKTETTNDNIENIPHNGLIRLPGCQKPRPP
jgi:hypothetical protein